MSSLASKKAGALTTSESALPVSSVDDLLRIETEAKTKFDAEDAEVRRLEDRRANPQPSDTPDDLIRLANDVMVRQAHRDFAKGQYERALTARILAENAEVEENRQNRRTELDKQVAAAVCVADSRYSKPLTGVLAFVTELDQLHRDVCEFNECLDEGEEPIKTFEELLRISPAEPDQEIEEVVDVSVALNQRNMVHGRVIPGGLYETVKKKVKRVIHGRSRIIPTPLPEIFEAPALRPGEKNFRVPGTRRNKYSIDVNGCDYNI